MFKYFETSIARTRKFSSTRMVGKRNSSDHKVTINLKPKLRKKEKKKKGKEILIFYNYNT